MPGKTTLRKATPGKGTPRANEMDARIGKTIREIRLSKGMSQQKLSDRVSVNFQQIQKYENGVNRATCGRLWELSLALDVPVGAFFKDLPEIPDASEVNGEGMDLMSSKETLTIVRDLFQMDQKTRHQLMKFIRQLRKSNPAEVR